MLKRVIKVLIIFVSVVLVFVIGFVLTLQIFEYRPKDLTELEVMNNLDDSSENYVSLDTTIKILTFNTGYASLSNTEDFVMDGGEKGRMDSIELVEANIQGIKDILTASNADIYLLQEVDVDSSRSYHTAQLEAYQTLINYPTTLGYNYRCIFVPFPFSFGQMMGSVNSGIVSMINFYTDDASRVQLPGSFSWPISLANLKRCLVVSRLKIQNTDKELVVINVHLSAYDDGSMRLQEMEALREIMADEIALGNYVVVGGDFNQTFPQAYTKTELSDDQVTYEYTYPLKSEDLWVPYPMDDTWFVDNGFQFATDITSPTCRLLHQPLDLVNDDNNQYYVIDGFIVSSNITIERVETINQEFEFSDHNPVEIEIKLIP